MDQISFALHGRADTHKRRFPHLKLRGFVKARNLKTFSFPFSFPPYSFYRCNFQRSARGSSGSNCTIRSRTVRFYLPRTQGIPKLNQREELGFMSGNRGLVLIGLVCACRGLLKGKMAIVVCAEGKVLAEGF